MLTPILQSSAARISEVRRFFRELKSKENRFLPLTPSEELSMLKGLFFVYLYGAYEYSVLSSVQRFLQIVNSFGHMNNELKPYFHSIAQDDLCKSLISVGSNKKWSKRRELFNRVLSSEIINIDDTAIPNDGKNLKYKQLNEIWESLSCASPVVPKNSIIGRLEEIVENRNAVAHGRESPITIGSRYTCNDLERILDDIDELCTYFINSLNVHLNAKTYLN